jgi:protein-S-isoprenylcysteine O-methyltransferase Ste14
MQKTVQLENKPGLIKNHLFSILRNPNYFGEFLIYTSFNLLSQHWFPFTIMLSAIACSWLPNMYNKEKSLSRYDEYKEYKSKTKMFIPFIW